MPDPKNIPSLLKLLDDESPYVREKVIEELHAFGSSLRDELARLTVPLSPDQELLVKELLDHHNRAWLRDAWSGWLGVSDDKEKLEYALNLLAQFQLGRQDHLRLGALLTDLAGKFHTQYPHGDAGQLAAFLFRIQGLSGNHADYYNPQNSNLIHVIEQKRGIPISLACIYILVGHRLRLDIRGCNVPGHFLALANVEGRGIIVDCFNGGRFLDEAELTKLNNTVPVTMDDIATLECSATTIIARVLRNLVNAYHLIGDEKNKGFMTELLQTLEGVQNDSPE